jgi:hypothetical protein
LPSCKFSQVIWREVKKKIHFQLNHKGSIMHKQWFSLTSYIRLIISNR